LQILLDRILLSRDRSDAVAAAIAAGVLIWTPLLLFQYTANYATTFVAQYTGAGQPDRVGPVVWQAFYFSAAAGLVPRPVGDFRGEERWNWTLVPVAR
jgi:MATE family multidrug resistance protein